MPEDPAKAVKDLLRADLKAAMKAHNTAEALLLRALLAAIDNAEAPAQNAEQSSAMSRNFGEGAAEVDRLSLSRKQLDALLAGEIEAREHAAAEMEQVGRADRAELLRAEAALARRYLA